MAQLHFITHNDTPQSVGLLLLSDQPVAEACTGQTERETSMCLEGIFFILLYSVLHPYLFFVLIVLHFVFYLYLQHTTQTSLSQARFFVLFSLLYIYFFCPDCLGFCVLSFTVQHTQRNANIHAPGGIRTRNSSKRLAADTGVGCV